MVKSRLRGGERASSFEYRMPVGKERLGSSIPDSWPLLGSKTLSITLCTVSRRAIGSFGTEPPCLLKSARPAALLRR